jgi:hypothetical protein
LEKEGYGRLDLDSRNEAVPARLAASRPGIEDRRGGGVWEVEEVEERAVDSSGSVSLVDVREVRPWDARFVDGWDCLLEVVEDLGFRLFTLLGLTGKNMAGS